MSTTGFSSLASAKSVHAQIYIRPDANNCQHLELESNARSLGRERRVGNDYE